MKLEYIGSDGWEHSGMTLGKIYKVKERGLWLGVKTISVFDDNSKLLEITVKNFKTPPIKKSESDVIKGLTEDNRQLSLQVIGLSTGKQMIVNINNELLADNHKLKEQLKFSNESKLVIARFNDKLEANNEQLKLRIKGAEEFIGALLRQ